MPQRTMHKFLVIRLSSIGDVILTTPLLRCLRQAYPDSSITFVVKKQFAEVLSQNPHIDHVLAFDTSQGLSGILRLRKHIRREGFTHILDLQRNIRSVMMSCFLPARVSTFSKKLLSRFMLIRLRINTYKTVKPVYLRYFEAVAPLGVAYDGRGTEVFPSADDKLVVGNLLSENSDLQLKKLLAIAPGAHWQNKRWPAERFAEAANQLCRQYGYSVVLIGGAGDADTCWHVIQKLEAPSVSLAGKLSLMQSAALLQQCNILLTNDTGMMHMAQATGTAVVAVFGPTTRELGFFPIETRSRVAEIPLYCRPCTQKGLDVCPKQHFRCMLSVTPQQVAALAAELEQEMQTHG